MRTPERLVDEMAVVLCGLPNVEDETSCILVLLGHGYRAAEVNDYLDEARLVAMRARDTWQGNNYDRRTA